MAESITIAIPARNEKENIESVVLDALRVGRQATDDLEVIVVDDHSTDGTYEILQALASQHPQLRVIRHPEHRGIVGAFKTIYEETRKELLFMNASDRQWRMEELFPMREALRQGPHDLVIARRVEKRYTPFRKFVSACYRISCETLFRVKVWDPGSIMMMREPIRRIQVMSTGVFEPAERVIRAHAMGYRVTKVDVEHLPRTSGRATGASWKNIRGAVRELIAFYIYYRRELAPRLRESRKKTAPRD